MYVTTADPTDAPDTVQLPAPDAETEATAGSLLLQVPPVTASFNVVLSLRHTAILPVITAGPALTVTVVVYIAHEGVINDIIAVPADVPVTTPAEVTMAIPVLLLLHVPGPAPVNVVVLPLQITVLPDDVIVIAFTVTVATAMQLPPRE